MKKNHTFHAIGTIAALALTAIQNLAQSTYEPYSFTTLAGGGGFVSPEETGTALRFSDPLGVAVDSAGNVYVADSVNHAIRKVMPAGEVTTLAGLPGTYGSADGTGSDARFNGFSGMGVAVDNTGNAYVADQGNHTIRKVTPAGVVTTLAGRAGLFGSANGTNNFARFREPNGVAVDGAGNVYVADSANSLIRKVTPVGTNWVVTTLAGRAGIPGSADGTNSAARFNYPWGIAVDSAGNLYVADPDNHNIRKITPVGTNWVVTTLAGNPSITDQSGNPLGGYADGTNRTARFNGPRTVAVDGAGNVYVADEGNSAIRQLTLVGTNWVVTTLAGLARHPGGADGIANAARFNFPFGVAVDSAGTLYVADTYNDAIRKVTSSGVVTTFAGLGGNFGSTEGIGIAARFAGPSGVAVDGSGSVYVADQVNHTIRKVTSDGVVTTLAGLAGYAGGANGTNSDARFNYPTGVAVDSAGNIYVGDAANNRIRKITPVGSDWAVTTLAGPTDSDDTETTQGYADGIGNAARFTVPRGVAVDSAGNLYVADTVNSAIREVTPAGRVTTLAGAAGWGSKDATGLSAQFYWPSGIAVDNATTNLYVADTYNHTIRKVTPARVVTTIAGKTGTPGSADGLGHEARFNFPSGMAVDSVGNVYVADTYNNAIRKLTPIGTNWTVTTLGGMPGLYGTADGTGSAARFCNPNGIAVDGNGNIYVADFYFNTIRKGTPAPAILNSRFTVGEFGFDLTGPTGHLVVVEASTDLVNWLPTWTNTFGVSALKFTDPQSGISSKRFYRTRLP
jgi:sugar lactone lactonase YvrE